MILGYAGLIGMKARKPRASGDDPEHYDIEVYAWE